ncbi:carbon-nitrogen hydrolase family protein [Marinicellulosiphila megalodicopiae]|uniref:carbon-nitrogen hydrolase family protein n=1 Tax=Marinicellulosiphila megalodicopiae TaxID=2724896 RepID=UPI003BB1B07A
MKLFAGQFNPIAGQLDLNIQKHIELIELAVKQGADLVFFSELSITGYQLTLADQFASTLNDECFDCFQKLSDECNVIIGIGVPLKSITLISSAANLDDKNTIGMIFFQPNKHRQSYSKQMIHSSEMPFFKQGSAQLYIHEHNEVLVPGICYESLQSSHSECAIKNGMTVYLASVAKDEEGYQRGIEHYSNLAKCSNVIVLMANSYGQCEGFDSCGLSAVWNKQGDRVAQLGNADDGLVGIDTVSCENFVIKVKR